MSIMAMRHSQKSPPSVRPRSARWNAWLCAFTKPGRVSGGTARILSAVTAAAAPTRFQAQLPNALTIARLILIPLFVGLIVTAAGGYSWPAAIVFAVAGVTDQIDGFLARRWRVESAFGKVADPLADRLMIDAAVILLWHAGRLPWVALAVPVRDLFLLVGYKPAVARGYDFEVNTVGKAATWLLYAALGFAMVTHDGTTWPLVIFWIGFALAIVSLAGYLRKAQKEVNA
jgi:CDP-diacylglycerol--glycerol-3-phosphate 3-phosphatidyltransferase